MNIDEIIKEAGKIAEALEDGNLASAFAGMREQVTKRSLKVVVIGDFKTGKSTLINRLFLKRNVLPVDYLEATAVPTHLSSGQMRMETWKRDTTTQDETLVESRENFLPEDVARVVTAQSDEERARLAKQYSKVVIAEPGILPPGITLVDTPGLNTTNSDVYVSTMYEARTAHALLYVVRAQQLSERELNLLADLAGMQQPSLPIHVVLTTVESEIGSQFDDLCATIIAQLSGIGVSNVGISVFSLAKGQTASQNDERVRAELDAFLRGEVQRGYRARAVRDTRPLLERLRAAVVSRLEMDGKGAEEIESIRQTLAAKREEYQRVVRSLLEDVAAAQYNFLENLKHWLEKLKIGYREDLEQKKDATEVLDAVKTWRELLPERVQRLLKLARSDFEEDLGRIESSYRVMLESVFRLPDSDIFSGCSSFIRVLTNTPHWVLYALDIAVFSLIMPTGFIGDMIVRFVGDKIPRVRELMPMRMLGKVVRSRAIAEFSAAVDEMTTKTEASMQSQFNRMCGQLRANLQSAGLFPEIENALEKAQAVRLSPSQKQKLLNTADTIQHLIASL